MADCSCLWLTMADRGRVLLTGADCGRLWPTLCSFCFATICEDLIVQVTMADCGRLWLTMADCGRLRPTGADYGRLWPALRSFCFATIFDGVIVQVTDTFWPLPPPPTPWPPPRTPPRRWPAPLRVLRVDPRLRKRTALFTHYPPAPPL